ncbi:hypothetical protein HBI56_023490 [Parastagonospora nodorum]|nr:hypothetical protein HBH56_025030 [Parastagonospora nodorum]QRC98841.1 hypothetical protein JI435_436450 [Parastagonospora nodorum SN15]KAH3934195.1 hypothetical protein HBH54_056970 [Parastagonospora nodorum]KAH3949601.1 hypothetical protein HBH53_084660 [Parastagonospora nodorum]KAH3976088.1 hypothetical protein HBH51_080680 [Parastagonospora nodorum]
MVKLDRSIYNIRVKPEYSVNAAYVEYLNSDDIMRSTSAQVHYTTGSEAVMRAFDSYGGEVHGTQLKSLASLLARGIRVALIHGDADIICNWYGGENASLELAELMPGYRDIFPIAGYADIMVINSYIGGHVCQYGNLSFS